MDLIPLYEITTAVPNSLYDRRVTAGLRTRKEFPAGTRFVEGRNFRTGKLLGLSILWETTIHSISLRDDNPRADKTYQDLMAASTEIQPDSYDTCMMTIDSTWSGMGYSASLGELAFDALIRQGGIDIATALSLLVAADEKSRADHE